MAESPRAWASRRSAARPRDASWPVIVRATRWLIVAAVASAPLLWAQRPAAVARRAPPSVIVDGRLDEWRGAPTIVLDQVEQVWSHKPATPWRGVDDLSAAVFVAADSAHLYLAGRVRDDSLVPGEVGRQWHNGDAIELFLDLGEPGREATRLDADVVQLFFMPFSQERRWGRVDWSVDPPRPTGIALNGVRVAFERVSEGEYSFEAVVPFHNFPKFDGRRDCGFSIAFDDHDVGSDRYQYMTWDGGNPVGGLEKFGVLRFEDTAPLATGERDAGGAVGSWLVARVPYLLLPLAGVLLLFAMTWGWSVLNRRTPALRPLGRTIGLLLFGAGLVLPTWWVGRRVDSHHSELARIVTSLRGDARLESVLGSVRGAERDRAFVDLLAGKSVVREQRFEYVFQPQLADDRSSVGVGALHFPTLGFRVRPYGIPLRQGTEEICNFGEPLPAGMLNVVVARPIQSGFAPRFGPLRANPVVTLARYRVGDSATPAGEVVEFAGPFSAAPTDGLSRSEVAFATVRIDAPIRALGLTATAERDLTLVGLTWVSPDRRQEPLFLGVDSLGGVPTDLRGRWPENAGFELASGQTATFRLADDRPGTFDKVSVFYAGMFRGRPFEIEVGSRVADLELEFASGDPQVVAFEHHTSMFFDEDRFNPDIPDGNEVRVAFRWSDEDEEARLTMMREIALPPGANVRGLVFRNVGPYPIRFRSLVFGRKVEWVETYPKDSPLIRTGDPGHFALSSAMLADLRGARVALYRDGRLSASTLLGTSRDERATLPGDARPATLDDIVYRRVQDRVDEVPVYEAYTKLPGEGWSSALLGVFLRDDGHAESARVVHRVGFLLCVASIPILLLMLSDLLGVLKNLRLRLVSLMSAATLVPLTLLSMSLLGAIESGHEKGLREDLGNAVSTASRRIDDEQRKLAETAQSWLADLAAQVADPRLRASDDFPAALRNALEPMMINQLPPAWKDQGGYLQFDFQPRAGSKLAARSVFVGNSEMRSPDTPLRSEPGVFLTWGVPFVGVRREVEISEVGICALSVARRMDAAFLADVGSGRSVVLCDMGGYPLSASGSPAASAEELLADGVDPGSMKTRARLKDDILRSGIPVVSRHPRPDHAWLASYEVVRDSQKTPRLLLGVVDRDREATLSLAMGPVPVRSFLLVAVGLVLVLAAFLSFVVTTRISRPIDELERGAQALRRGELDVHVPSEEGGQIGRLTKTFNQMADDLRGRIQDLRLINRGMQELSSQLELPAVIASAIRFYKRQSSADGVRLMTWERERGRLVVYGGGEGSIEPSATDVAAMLAAVGPHSARLDPTRPGDAISHAFPLHRSMLVLPLLLAGRTRGFVVLLFDSAQPSAVNLDLLWTMASQTSAALENARLYQHAVEDFHTGALRPDYFASRVAQEVGRAQAEGSAIALFGLRLDDGEAIARALGADSHARYLARLVDGLRTTIGGDGIVCRSEKHELRMLVPSCDRSGAERLVPLVEAAAARHQADLPPEFQPLRVSTAVAVYPEDGASGAFLFDSLSSDLASGRSASDRSRRRLPRRPSGAVFLDSAAMVAVVRTLERVAPTDLSILLEGETGTGKEVLADLIHEWSRRASGPLVKVHCAALSEGLLQSELFGHEKGAFTGATDRRIGRFERAHGGTIFLDEICEISLDVQVKLLRVLQEREIDRVGGSRPLAVDVRVIAATNQDVEAMVAAGTFREDLYYRLQGVLLRVPPLRERKQEIPGLVEYFRALAVADGHTRVRGFSTGAMDELFRHDWPGNIRELRNTVFRAMVLAEGELVEASDLVSPRSAGELPSVPVSPAPVSAAQPTALLPAVPQLAAPPPAAVPRAESPPAASPPAESATSAAAPHAASQPSAREQPAARPSPASETGRSVVDADGAARAPERAGDGRAERVVEIPRPAAEGGPSPRLERLAGWVRDRGSLTSAEYGELAGVSQRTALRDLADLVSTGRIRRVGKRRGARYVLADSSETASRPDSGSADFTRQASVEKNPER